MIRSSYENDSSNNANDYEKTKTDDVRRKGKTGYQMFTRSRRVNQDVFIGFHSKINENDKYFNK